MPINSVLKVGELVFDVVKGAAFPLGITAYTESVDDFDATIGSRDKEELERKNKYAKEHKFKSLLINSLQFLYSPSGVKLITSLVVMPLMFYFAVYSTPVLCVIAGISALTTARSIYKDGQNLRKLKKQQKEAVTTKKIANLKNIQKILLKKFPELSKDFPELPKKINQIHTPKGFNKNDKSLKPGNRLTTRALPEAIISFLTALTTISWVAFNWIGAITIGLSALTNLCYARIGQKEQYRLVKLQRKFEVLRHKTKEQANLDYTPGTKGNDMFLKQRLSSELSTTKKMMELAKKYDRYLMPPDFIKACQMLIEEADEPLKPVGSTAYYARVAFIKGMNPITDYETLSPLAKYNDIKPFNANILSDISNGVPLRHFEKQEKKVEMEIEMQELNKSYDEDKDIADKGLIRIEENCEQPYIDGQAIEMIEILRTRKNKKNPQSNNPQYRAPRVNHKICVKS